MDKLQDLETVLKKYKGQRVLIALRGHPDPDSMASALAHQYILNHFGIDSVVAHSKSISDRENRTIRKLAGLDFIHYDNSNINFKDFSGYSLVDSQLPDEDFVPHLNEHKAITIVDHHDPHGNLKSEYIHIDNEVGSASTIYAEYLKSLELLIKHPEKKDLNQTIATVLMHGIKNDTDELTNGNSRDYNAIGYLSTYADLEILRKMSKRSLSAKTMDNIVTAYNNRNGQENYALAGIGIIPQSERDSIPRAADFLLMREGLDTVLVYGIVDDFIECSFRTSNDSIRPSDFIKEAFPDVQEGKYGGKYDKGGFKLPIGIFKILSKNRGANFLVQTVDELMKIRFYEKLGVHEDQEVAES